MRECVLSPKFIASAVIKARISQSREGLKKAQIWVMALN